jgi:WhiA LAGLIDADG-like domain/WhiA C-terminal HTH domain
MPASTLSADAKDALARTPVEAAHCRAALRDGLLTYGATARRRIFRTQRPAIARLLWSLLDDRKEHPIRRVPGLRLHRLPSYEIDAGPVAAAPPKARCDRRMDLRAAFLACGSLAAPARGYHLEFVPPDDEALRRLLATLRAEGAHPKIAPRKGRSIVYFKDIDEITQVLAAIGSSGALLHLEDVRALKETKNRIHRLVNTEAANVDRAASAAATQRHWISLLADAYGLRKLSSPLREIAELRLAHPSDTLAELGRRCSPEVKKSTVNGRIATLVRLAKSLSGPAGKPANNE